MATTAQVRYTYTPLRCEAVHDLTRFYSDIETYVINNDRTLFSRLAHNYESAIVHLLAQHEVDGIPPATLRAFQESYASTAFHCRFPHCDRLSLGFATAELRLEHEIVHVQRVYCQTVSCQYSRIGFAKKGALNAHTRKHHVQSDILHIPAKVRRTTVGGAKINEVEPQQLNIQQSQLQDDVIINRFAKRLIDSCNGEVREKFQRDVADFSEDMKRQLLDQGVDPLFFRFRQHAVILYKRGALGPQAKVNIGTQKLMPNQIAVPQRTRQGFDSNTTSEKQMEALRRGGEMHTDNSSVYPPPIQPRLGLGNYRPYHYDLQVEPQASYAPVEPNPYMQTQDNTESYEFDPFFYTQTDPHTRDGIIEEEELSTIKCICGFADDDGNTVLCEQCDTWQHIVCYYEVAQYIPDVHECINCAPRPVNVQRAFDKQRQRREMFFQQNGYAMTTTKNTKKRARETVDHAPRKRSSPMSMISDPFVRAGPGQGPEADTMLRSAVGMANDQHDTKVVRKLQGGIF
jgi:hypothetical protein